MNRFSTATTSEQIYDLMVSLYREDKELYYILKDDLITWNNLMSFLEYSIDTFPQNRFMEIAAKINGKVEEINAKHDAYRLSKEGN
jgi:hypothetical protein